MVFSLDNRREQEFPDSLEKIMEQAALEAMGYEGFPLEGEVSVSIVDNEEIQEINNTHRKINRPTDVLSFPMINYDSGEKPPKTGHYLLGDIVLSMEQAVEQAAAYGHSLEREVGFLTVHSMLHLMGYDHETQEEEADMCRKQEEILEKMGLKR